MKHILKPVGHCLATAVLTSTLLKVYPASIADAAPSEVPSPTAQDAHHPSGESTLNPLNEPAEPSVAAVDPSTSPLTVETIIAPAVAGTVVSNSPDSPSLNSDPFTESSQSIETQPTESAPLPSAPSASYPDATTDTSTSTAELEPLTTSQKTPNSPSKQTDKQPSSSDPETLAAMRQQIEQKLAEIVARDRATREEQFQQNLVRVILHYAEVRDFKRAREVAQHPALSLELQTTLLAQIDQIEAQIPGSEETLSAAATASAATETSRAVPSQSLAYIPLNQPWTGTFSIPQCPAPTPPTTQATIRSQPLNSQSNPETSPLEFGHRVAATLVETSEQILLQNKVEQPVVQSIRPATAKSSTPKPVEKQVEKQVDSPAVAKLTDSKPAVIKLVTSFKPAAIQSSAPRISTFQPATAAQKTIADRFEFQPPSPLEVMGYWVSKPLTEAGIRLPFLPRLSNPTIKIQADKAAIAASSTEHLPSLTAFSLNPAGSTDLLQPALTFSPYLVSLKQSVVELQFAVKDAIKLSLPAVQAESQRAANQATSQKTPQMAALNCFSPVIESSSLALSPALARQMGWGNLIFPLPIPAVLTSAFGWRIHPISGDRRFHAGIDLGAPMGTPVVAAMAGRIVAADHLGGYGLAVVVETTDGNYRNLYAHLSGIAVRPGTLIQQGNILGWVGSTGNSTGPHLHFETQIPTTNGWMAIDPLSATARTIANRGTAEVKQSVN